jgi:hypothetical protein
VGEENLQVGAPVHDTTENQSSEDQTSLGEVADGVAELVSADPAADHGVAPLMKEEDCAKFLSCLEEGKELGLVIGASGNVVADHCPLQIHHRHHMLEFGDRRRWILHRNRSQPHELVRMVLDHLSDLFVAFAGDHLRSFEFVGVLVETRIGSHHLHVDPVGLHIRQALV